ncbi:nuclear pore complex protein Nup133 [Battus philenor]|uniref:nuclear pore complex protein Nup133 n=1 Tax=Battus philenor TaxID=42288 RepID=UPI0035D006CB
MDFNNTGGMRSPFSPRVKQSITGRRAIGLSSAKKPQSNYGQSTGGQQTGDVIYKTPMLTLETYGLPLPVMVTEALTFASGDVSARMSSCGWCWVVAGRRLLTWPCQPGLAAVARELTLPQTDLAHKAELVVLFYEDDAQLPSCIGVSPEGVVRYWPCVGQEGVYVDVSAELAGQECEQLGEPTKSGLVLATTTCTVVLLTPTVSDGRPTVTCRTLRPPSGWLGGIGRRVSLLFFGSMPAHVDTKLVGVVVLGGGGEAEECVALVAGGPLLQLWRGAELHEHHLRRALADAHSRAHLPHLTHLAPQLDLNSLEIMALDVHASGPHSLMLLIAAVNVARSPEKRYAIVNIDVQHAHNPRVASLQPLRAPRDDVLAPPRCLPLRARPLLYTPAYVALVPGTNSNEKVECIELAAEGDRVLGAALCDGVPLVFSRKHGVLALCTPRAPVLPVCDGAVSSPTPSDMYDGNLSMYEIDPNEMEALATDPRSKLKTAFLFHLRRDAAAARIVAEEFGVGGGGVGGGVDSALDACVCGAARELLDDAPAGDPRWRRAAPRPAAALGASAALQLPAQLRDKARALALFLDFLRAHGLWRRLGYVTRESGDGVISTQQLLGAYGERLAAARALRRLQEEGATLVDAAVQQVSGEAERAEGAEWRGGWRTQEACAEEEEAAALRAGALSAADVVFRRVSRAQRLLRAVARAPPPAADARAAAAHAAAALQLLTSVLGEVHAWRAQWVATGGPPPPATLGDPSLQPALLQLHTRATTECARACPDATLRSSLLEAGAAFADLLLTDALAHSHAHDPAYQALRRDVIKPYVDAGQTRRAAALAEKFQDFELLVQLCVEDNDMERLHSYIDKYADQGLAEIAFAWLASGPGGRRALLVRQGGARVPERLSRWLGAGGAAAGAGGARAELLALHELGQRRPAAAASALSLLAADPAAPVQRTTTAASLGKLCLLAAETADEETWRALEWRLGLCEQQAALPAALRPHHDGPLLDPAHMLQLYIDSESKSLTEYDFKKALDLTEFIEDPEEREHLRLQVWCACVQRDEWEELASEAAAEALRGTLLYRLADLVHLMGGELRQWLPPLPALLAAPSLAQRAAEPRFHFALKLAYEYIHDAHCDTAA